MEDDDGEESGFCSVTVPVSLIHALTFEMLHVIDQWHHDRNITEVDIPRCFTAMIAAIEATLEQLDGSNRKETLQ